MSSLQDTEPTHSLIEAEELLKHERDLYNATLAAAGAAIVVLDAEGRLLRFNRQAELLSGYQEAEVLGRHPFEFLIPAAEHDAVHANLFPLSSGHLIEQENHWLHRDGRQLLIHWSNTGLFDDTGRRTHLIAVGIDVTGERESQDLLNAVFQSLPDLLCIASMDGYFQVLNPAWERTLGWTTEELRAQPYLEFVHPSDRQRTLDAHEVQSQRGEPVIVFENRYRCKDGSYRWLRWNSVPLAERGVLVASARDVTDQRRGEDYARSLLEASLDPLVTIDPEGKITDVNEATTKVTGVVRKALIGTDFSDYFTDPEMARQGYQQVFAQGLVTDYPLTIRHKTGMLTDVLYNASLYRNREGQVLGVFAAARDIGERKQAEEALARTRRDLERRTEELTRNSELLLHQATHDSLTGLHNRRWFEETVAQELLRVARYHHQVNFLYLDVNKMKTVNDTYGHQAGDDVLKKVARVLQKLLRVTDVIARIGGDEFVVMLPEIASEQAAVLANELRAQFDRVYGYGVGIGLVSYRQHVPTSLDEVLADADRAMYDSKSSGTVKHLVL